MRVAIWLLLAAVVSAEVYNLKEKLEDVENPIGILMRSINSILPVVREVMNDVFGKVINNSRFRALLAIASNLVAGLTSQRHLPRVPERWWGDQHRGRRDSSIRPFRVQFSQDMVTDLRARIHGRRNITRSLRGTAHAYGTNADYLSHFLDYWADGYDFQQREAWLNRFPQYITNIQGLDMHYIHVKPTNPRGKKVLPLLMLHGWPVTAFEFVHVIDQLLQQRDGGFVFEMIVPNLPGYGYSEGTSEIGLSQYQMAGIMKNLMRRLGRPQFYIHAGDIGQLVADSMAVLYPDRVRGLHTNFAFSLRPQTLVKYVLGQLMPSAVEPQHQSRMYPLAERARFYLENTGYAHIHGTRPDNVGHGLEDSPVAQASWLLQNIILATSARNLLAVDGNLTRSYHLLDWLDSFTVYWAAQCMVTSIRSYAEILAWFQDPLALAILTTPTSVPFAAIRFRHELIYQPDDFLRDKYPTLLQATTLDFGGHFAGYEEPAVLADSIWTSVKKMEAFNEKHMTSQ